MKRHSARFVLLFCLEFCCISCSSVLSVDIVEHQDVWKANCVAFAEELCQLRWTPIRPMPSSSVGFISDGTEDTNVIAGRKYYQPNVEIVGIPYSCAGEYGRNIGSDVRIETFMTALKNPNSVVYTMDTRDIAPSSLSSCYYGNNCSSFTNILQNIPVLCFGRNCFFGGNRIIEFPQDIECAQIGDMVYLQREVQDSGHAVIIIGLTKEDGDITNIRIAEETLHNAVIVDYSKQSFIDAFFKGGRGYEYADIYRNNGIHNLTEYEDFNAEDYQFSNDIGLNLGNNTNYDKCDSLPIEVTIFNGDSFDLIKDGMIIETHKPSEGEPGYGGTRVVTIDKSLLDCGLYEVRPNQGISQFFSLTNRGTASAHKTRDGSVVVSSYNHSSNVIPFGILFFSNTWRKTTRGMYEMDGKDTVIVPSSFVKSIDTYNDITYIMIAYRNEYGNIYSDKVQIIDY